MAPKALARKGVKQKPGAGDKSKAVAAKGKPNAKAIAKPKPPKVAGKGGAGKGKGGKKKGKKGKRKGKKKKRCPIKRRKKGNFKFRK